jgi:4'-phosphopantetheinyl transferase
MNDPSIDLWNVQLDEPHQSHSENLTLLSESEKKRHDRFVSHMDQEHYAAAHASLRRILAGYLKVAPADIAFCVNEHDKPAVEPGCNPDRLEFNLSHSAGLALVAINFIQPVGVDVERVRPLNDHLKLAERHFSPAEISTLKSMGTEVSSHAFIQLWAGKEALIKARGNGLSLPLDRFDLDTLIDQPQGSACTVKDPEDGRTWWVSPLNIKEGYVGAICVEGQSARIQLLEMTLTDL